MSNYNRIQINMNSNGEPQKRKVWCQLAKPTLCQGENKLSVWFQSEFRSAAASYAVAFPDCDSE